ISRFIAENHYSSMKLNEFLQDYKSPIPQSPPRTKNRKMSQEELKKMLEERKAKANAKNGQP
ncbi:MAG: hypothetical protein ACPG49_14030, partial [Chitinophagales bacterium]